MKRFIPLFVFLMSALVGLDFVNAQTPITPGVTSAGFSPSTASFGDYVVTAYTYESSAHNHMVGVTRSTDRGVTWSNVTNPFGSTPHLPQLSGSDVDNMDDPQIIAIGGGSSFLL